MYASRVKWHPYLYSLMFFLLTCAGRAQDAYDVDAEKFLKALKNGEPYEISRKKTKTIHFYVPDTCSTPHILPFV